MPLVKNMKQRFGWIIRMIVNKKFSLLISHHSSLTCPYSLLLTPYSFLVTVNLFPFFRIFAEKQKYI